MKPDIDLTGLTYWGDLNWIVQTLWWLVPVLIFVALCFVVIEYLPFDAADWLAPTFAVLASLWLIVGGIAFMIAAPDTVLTDNQDNMRIEQLEKLGYTEVDFTATGAFDKDQFTAYNGDNELVKAAIVELPTPYTYKVIEY